MRLNFDDLHEDNRLTLAFDLHNSRVIARLGIYQAAQKLHTSPEILMKLEIGRCDTVLFDLLQEAAKVYNEKLFIGLGGSYV